MLNNLRIKVDELIESTGDEKYIVIKNILENDKCFFEMNVDTAISILMDLGMDKETAKKRYISLIDKDNL